MSRPRLPEFREIVDGLQARPLDVAERYAPGGFVDGAIYHARNPSRADGSMTSFIVNLSGPLRGRYKDFARGEQGDMLDLIRLALGCDQAQALQEACSFLGIHAEETEAQRDLRRREAQRAREAAEAAAREAAHVIARKRRAAHALWLECRAEIEGTPAAAYLEARGVGPAQLGRAPRALRFHPALRYQHTDPDTGEVIEGEWPAMVAAVHGPTREGAGPEFFGVHRTWLARGPDGRWGKAPVPQPRKVLGSVRAGFIRLWSGWGPRGGKGAPIASAGGEARVFIAEGIEDALSVAVLLGRTPGLYAVAAISIGNFAQVALPPALRRVTIVADVETGDDKTQAMQRAQVEAAIARLAGEGREVRVWRNQHGGKDLNDALRAAAPEPQKGAA